MSFAHLHNHTQYSLLDGASNIKKMVSKAINDGQKGIAITDHGNMFGVFEFVAEIAKRREEGIDFKAVVGCEFYLVENRFKKDFTRENKDKRYHQLMLAKNAIGYQNLIKLCSLGFVEGYYSKYPRIDKELVKQYHEGLIATTCCLGALVPKTLLHKGEEAAEEEFKWWLDLFGDDYYVELQRHGIPEQDKLNEVLKKFAKKYNVKIICTNDNHYIDQSDFVAHDVLLCINTNEKLSTPALRDFVENDEEVTRGKRFAFTSDCYYLKSISEMATLFNDIPDALANTLEILDKIDILDLKKDVLLPAFEIPSTFNSQDQYLHHWCMQGAKERYGEITPKVEERLHFELGVIAKMGFAGYFLIVADFIKAGKEMGVVVGPGRGSAAGSAVAYCIGITNIDPIKYDLLFERFLNPDRKSMPDIDTDFDDEGRQKVIDYVVKKYGKSQVAQIVTFGTMASKSSIKDVARVLEYPFEASNQLSKLVSDRPGIKLHRLLHAPLEGENSLDIVEGLKADDIKNAQTLRDYYHNNESKESEILHLAEKLEGSVRNTGVHAAGIIIAPKDITEILPVCTSKDSELFLTQYEGEIIENAGVLKMDFLGLKTLSIINDTLKLIKENHNLNLDIDNIPLDDAKTFLLFQQGKTNVLFQYESAGMQKSLKELKPDTFEDLIAMNALYRPGPMQYIPSFIKRKLGQEPIHFDLPEMEEILVDTYGITVYQEQVMLLSQKLAKFTKGEADNLRKAMGKKDKKTLDKLKPLFLSNAKELGHPEKILEKIWLDWEKFAAYAFNKSHSTCYAFVGYQTAYLKAHYPSEFMAANLTHSNTIDKITFIMDECKNMGIKVLGPDINESKNYFSVNAKGEIRFSLAAIKGVGEVAIAELINERKENGDFNSLYNMAERLSSKTLNKRIIENLINGGAFDCFGIARARYFITDTLENIPTYEKLLKHGAHAQVAKKNVVTNLFGEAYNEHIEEPEIPQGEEWNDIEKLRHEKELIGIFLSGHPLDTYNLEVKALKHTPLNALDNFKNKEIHIVGIITQCQTLVNKRGETYARIKLEDYDGMQEITLWNETYLKFSHLLQQNQAIAMKGMYRERYNQMGIFQFNPISIMALSQVTQKVVSTVNLTIKIDEVNKIIIDELMLVLSKHKGTKKLNVIVTDEEINKSLIFASKSLQVDPNDLFIQEIKQLEFFEINFE